jgi:hypothetical protein
MSDSRTVEDFVQFVDHLTGVKLRIFWLPLYGLSIRDVETGEFYALGYVSRATTLTSGEQESICRGLNREHLLVTLGFDPPDDA